MFSKRSLVLCLALGLMAILATPASANELQTAMATANCQGYNLSVFLKFLTVGKTYTVDYNFTLICNGGTPVQVPGKIKFVATAKSETVTASGAFTGLSGSCTVSGTVFVENEPKFSKKIIINGVLVAPLMCSLPTATCAMIVAEQGVPITPVQLVATGGAGPPYTFTASGLPAGLSISSSGLISGTPTVSGTFSYTVTITDVAGNMGTINCSVTVAPPPTLTCSGSTTGEVGVPFNSGPMTVTGGIPPYTFSIVGTLPAGLTLNTSTGAVTGTPTAPGSFSIKVTDSVGGMATGCMITIVPGPSLTCSGSTTGEVGVPFNSGPMTVTGGTPPYTFSVAGTLPPGLTLNTSTGAVTGTPTAPGSFSIKVTDSLGVMATGCMITINPPPSLTCSGSTTGDVGVPFNSGPMTVTGGVPPYTFSIVGTLPAGLTLNTSTGAVTGTPTASGSFSIKVTDSLGAMATGCMITINPPPMLTCSGSTTGEVGVPFNSGPMTVTGGVPPYTFSIVGTLPPGLTLNTSTGAVTGTPTAPGSFSIMVTDSVGGTATGCMITIVPGLTVTCGSNNAGVVGVPFDSGPEMVTGGVPPYTFSVGSGTLPPGLSLNTSTGEVTGTPTAPGTFTIIVTDSLGAVGTGCTITITPMPCLSTQLGAAGAFGILGLQGANIQLSSGPLQVNANVGIGVNGQLNLSGGAILQGTLFADPSAQINISGGSGFAGGIQYQSMTAIQNDVAAEAAAIAGLTPTQTFSQINNPITITGNGGQNVIQVNGRVQLSGGAFTISGGPTDTFIFIITGGFQLSGGSNIVLNGVAANDVLWYFPGTGDQVQTSGKANTAGIFLAPQRQIQINGGTHVSEFISGGQLSFQSNPIVNAIPPCGPPQLMLACPATDGVVGNPYNSALVATGGEPPYTFSITAGGLPNGLTLNTSNGDITGTPTTAGAFNFTGQVVDSSGQAAGTVADNCAITVGSNNYVCVIPPSGTQIGGSGTSWNKFNTQGPNDIVWINMHIGTPSGVPTNVVTTVQFTGVSFVLNGVTYGLPDGFLIFDPSAPAIPSTTYNPAFAPNGSWTTTLNPSNLSDEIFFDGQAVPVDSNITGGGTANITYTTESTDNDLAFSWQWSAAVYTYWPGNNQANILAYHGGGLHAGTPQNPQVQQSLIQGPRGGGGSNYTGSWSATGNGACPGAQ